MFRPKQGLQNTPLTSRSVIKTNKALIIKKSKALSYREPSLYHISCLSFVCLCYVETKCSRSVCRNWWARPVCNTSVSTQLQKVHQTWKLYQCFNAGQKHKRSCSFLKLSVKIHSKSLILLHVYYLQTDHWKGINYSSFRCFSRWTHKDCWKHCKSIANS